jgi:hypothetical protein
MAHVSVKLDELLMADCHVRCALRLLKELNEELSARVAAVQQSCSSRTRFLPTIGRPEELAAVEAARADLAKAASAQETMLKLHATIDAQLGAELDSYVRAVSPAYERGLMALNNLVSWPALLDRLALKLAGLLSALGSARNMASSGYDWQRRTFSSTALEAISRARAAAQELDETVLLVNNQSDRHQLEILNTPHAAAVLPRVPVVGFEARIARVQSLTIPEVQAEFDRVLEMCGMLESTGLKGLREATERVAATHSELSRAYLETYLKQLRAHMDQHRLVPGQTTAQIHRLQLQHFGKINFPYEVDA